MTIPVCANCSAPLATAHGEQKCTFCGALNVVGAREGPQVKIERVSDTRFGGSGILLIVLGLPALIAAGITLEAMLRRPATAAPPVLHPADLHGLGDNFTELDAIDPKVILPLDAFDPLRHLTWATALARTWSPDARLINLDLTLVRENGTVDVSIATAKDPIRPRVKYEFASKGRDVAAKQLTKVSEKIMWSAIDIIVEKGGLRAVVAGNSSDDRDPTALALGCGVTQIVAIWRAKGLPFRQGYSLELSDTIGHGPPSWKSGDWGVPAIDIDCKPLR